MDVEYDFSLMTLNVEEYLHGFDGGFLGQIGQALKDGKIDQEAVKSYFAVLKAHVFDKVAQLNGVIEAQRPDVLCIQEHSLGIDLGLLSSFGLGACLEDSAYFDEADLLAALLPNGYQHFACRTGEAPAKCTELANVVAWRSDRFEAVAQVGEQITPKGKKTPSGRGTYTPRSAACVELRPTCGSAAFIVCSTHLMGGRFEDQTWAADNEAGVHERVRQVAAIHTLLGSASFSKGAPAVIAGDFNVMKLGFSQGPFAQGSKKYVIGDTKLYSWEKLEKDYYEVYVPYQTAVHHKLEELGYAAAYGRPDDIEDMKTTRFSGCTDWIYCKGLVSRKDEQIISTDMLRKGGATDHSGVLVTLTLTWKAPMEKPPSWGFIQPCCSGG